MFNEILRPLRLGKYTRYTPILVWTIHCFDLRSNNYQGSYYFQATREAIRKLVGYDYTRSDYWTLNMFQLERLGVTLPKRDLRCFFEYKLELSLYNDLSEIGG